MELCHLIILGLSIFVAILAATIYFSEDNVIGRENEKRKKLFRMLGLYYYKNDEKYELVQRGRLDRGLGSLGDELKLLTKKVDGLTKGKSNEKVSKKSTNKR